VFLLQGLGLMSPAPTPAHTDTPSRVQ
jgi:hypothetical protein